MNGNSKENILPLSLSIDNHRKSSKKIDDGKFDNDCLEKMQEDGELEKAKLSSLFDKNQFDRLENYLLDFLAKISTTSGFIPRLDMSVAKLNDENFLINFVGYIKKYVCQSQYQKRIILNYDDLIDVLRQSHIFDSDFDQVKQSFCLQKNFPVAAIDIERDQEDLLVTTKLIDQHMNETKSTSLFLIEKLIKFRISSLKISKIQEVMSLQAYEYLNGSILSDKENKIDKVVDFIEKFACKWSDNELYILVLCGFCSHLELTEAIRKYESNLKEKREQFEWFLNEIKIQESIDFVHYTPMIADEMTGSRQNDHSTDSDPSRYIEYNEAARKLSRYFADEFKSVCESCAIHSQQDSVNQYVPGIPNQSGNITNQKILNFDKLFAKYADVMKRKIFEIIAQGVARSDNEYCARLANSLVEKIQLNFTDAIRMMRKNVLNESKLSRLKVLGLLDDNFLEMHFSCRQTVSEITQTNLIVEKISYYLKNFWLDYAYADKNEMQNKFVSTTNFQFKENVYTRSKSVAIFDADLVRDLFYLFDKDFYGPLSRYHVYNLTNIENRLVNRQDCVSELPVEVVDGLNKNELETCLLMAFFGSDCCLLQEPNFFSDNPEINDDRGDPTKGFEHASSNGRILDEVKQEDSPSNPKAMASNLNRIVNNLSFRQKIANRQQEVLFGSHDDQFTKIAPEEPQKCKLIAHKSGTVQNVYPLSVIRKFPLKPIEFEAIKIMAGTEEVGISMLNVEIVGDRPLIRSEKNMRESPFEVTIEECAKQPINASQSSNKSVLLVNTSASNLDERGQTMRISQNSLICEVEQEVPRLNKQIAENLLINKMPRKECVLDDFEQFEIKKPDNGCTSMQSQISQHESGCPIGVFVDTKAINADLCEKNKVLISDSDALVPHSSACIDFKQTFETDCPKLKLIENENHVSEKKISVSIGHLSLRKNSLEMTTAVENNNKKTSTCNTQESNTNNIEQISKVGINDLDKDSALQNIKFDNDGTVDLNVIQCAMQKSHDIENTDGLDRILEPNPIHKKQFCSSSDELAKPKSRLKQSQRSSGKKIGKKYETLKISTSRRKPKFSDIEEKNSIKPIIRTKSLSKKQFEDKKAKKIHKKPRTVKTASSLPSRQYLKLEKSFPSVLNPNAKAQTPKTSPIRKVKKFTKKTEHIKKRKVMVRKIKSMQTVIQVPFSELLDNMINLDLIDDTKSTISLNKINSQKKLIRQNKKQVKLYSQRIEKSWSQKLIAYYVPRYKPGFKKAMFKKNFRTTPNLIETACVNEVLKSVSKDLIRLEPINISPVPVIQENKKSRIDENLLEQYLKSKVKINPEILQRSTRSLKISFDGYSPTPITGPFTSVFRPAKFMDLTEHAIKSFNASEISMNTERLTNAPDKRDIDIGVENIQEQTHNIYNLDYLKKDFFDTWKEYINICKGKYTLNTDDRLLHLTPLWYEDAFTTKSFAYEQLHQCYKSKKP